ncbi:ribonuclease R [Brumimicrobium aurantiacum]|uniref:Ribonuclease R n=1 Tax=Brumimicrobium aurantiacum TaxID=1737063 RepID=A0A3E1F242_9FLAO|nr:ribonuclease R [Brumimicrobium aurantiacum]RFC55875.1 ribonuclease R [Brumimicrobium aurantiacum]
MSRKKIKKKGIQSAIRKIFENKPDQKYTAKEISAILQITDKNMRKLVLSILNDLKSENFLNEFQRGYFILNDNFQNSFIGTVDSTSRGAAYIVIPDRDGDIYVAPENTNKAFHGDEVEVEITRQRKNKTEGRIVRIINRKSSQFIGTLDVRNKFAFLILDNNKINVDFYIPLEKLKGAKNNEKVIARMTSWPKGVDSPYAEVLEVIGSPGDNDAEMYSILFKNEFEIEFPQEVIQESENVGIELDQEEVKNRRDLRDKLTFTIDPFDAKDFDDALSYEELENGNIEVGVHIADVSQYVEPGTAMDKEALKRGNSVYLEDRVIPMLPEQLSNFACSLRPNEDKFAFSAIFELDDNGKVQKEWFGKTVIHSDYRFAYEDAQEVIEGKSDTLKKEILAMDKIAKTIRKERMENGALSIESEEVSFVFDDEGMPNGVVKKVSKDANKLIEEFMLLANKRVALFLGKLPGDKGSNDQCIYRCHDKPSIDKLNTFSVFIEKFDYEMEFENIDNVSKKINGLLNKIKDTPEYDLIQSMAIRSMAKATYQTNNIGHYGLAFKYYTHFTSPIRRYADLVVHRLLMDKLENKQKNYGNKLNEISEHISKQERKAIESERESNKFFQAKYLQDKVGEEYEGTVSGLADFGMFVRMNENHCEGMITINSLPNDNYYFDNDSFQIIGRRTEEVFNFGDQVKVKVVGVDMLKKQVDLELVQ